MTTNFLRYVAQIPTEAATSSQEGVGSTNEAIILPKTLKRLSLSVLTAGDMFTAKRKKYNYYQMKELAKDPDIDFSKKTMLYAHGYLDSTSFPPSGIMGAEYKALGYNVLLLDTNWFATVEYPVAARLLRPIGKHTAEMLVELTKFGFNPNTLELVGLSFGGQTISFIAKSYKNITNTLLPRVISLDPSGPCFRYLGPKDRIDETDAAFVMVISTNIIAYGMAAPVGHVHFYVNGGEFQPGDVTWMYCPLLCSHTRSFTLWMSALRNSKHFIGMQCDSVQQARERNCYDRVPQVTNILGLDTDPTKQGIFFLATKNGYPYYMGKEGLKRENDFELSRLKKLNAEEVMRV